jgi:hypothetical protein
MQQLILVAVVLVGAALAQPSFNASYYTIDAIFSLPYAAITEPLRTYYDGINNMSRTGWYILLLLLITSTTSSTISSR